jgi:hypothetical protein
MIKQRTKFFQTHGHIILSQSPQDPLNNKSKIKLSILKKTEEKQLLIPSMLSSQKVVHIIHVTCFILLKASDTSLKCL